MKRLRIALAVCGLVLVTGLAVLARVHGTASLYQGAFNAGLPNTCHGWHTDHVVVLKNETPSPKDTKARLCDTLTLVNDDNAARLIAFGPHAEHITYSGVDEAYLYGGKTLKVILLQTGTYEFHDHLRDVLQGEVTVAP